MKSTRQLLARVAANLKPLTVTAALTADEQEYLDFYHINFSAEFAGLRHQLGFIESCEQRLAVHVLQPPDAQGVLLVVHGYLDHVGLMQHLIRYGLQRGYTVLAFDLPGHGLSSGDRVAIDDFSDYRRALESLRMQWADVPGDWHVIAQSAGAAAVLDYLLHRGGGLDKVVMLAPLVRPLGWWWVKLAHAVLHRLRDSMPREFAVNSNDARFLRWIRTDPLQSKLLSLRWIGALGRWLKALPVVGGESQVPVLLIQGDADRTVDWRYNVARVQQLVNVVKVVTLAGGRHHLANESSAFRTRIYACLDEFFGPAAVSHKTGSPLIGADLSS
jgi:alpha-beta hydrolase superfamily lysophospholipase